MLLESVIKYVCVTKSILFVYATGKYIYSCICRWKVQLNVHMLLESSIVVFATGSCICYKKYHCYMCNGKVPL